MAITEHFFWWLFVKNLKARMSPVSKGPFLACKIIALRNVSENVFGRISGVNILPFNLYFIREKFHKKLSPGKSFQPPKAVGKIPPREESPSVKGRW